MTVYNPRNDSCSPESLTFTAKRSQGWIDSDDLAASFAITGMSMATNGYSDDMEAAFTVTSMDLVDAFHEGFGEDEMEASLTLTSMVLS